MVITYHPLILLEVFLIITDIVENSVVIFKGNILTLLYFTFVSMFGNIDYHWHNCKAVIGNMKNKNEGRLGEMEIEVPQLSKTNYIRLSFS